MGMIEHSRIESALLAPVSTSKYTSAYVSSLSQLLAPPTPPTRTKVCIHLRARRAENG
ncbi:hypothetical protein SAMN04515675_6226 [Pseudomonas costantinii]|uniref:Uncharacterized protein n=1 Tax=Pseudomonas costantinii TaxID=168469 RepID=A0A1H5JTH9_9PSED|nr:hypothetical protein SAMN04515675_6226 [Pseudomonas costantinii]